MKILYPFVYLISLFFPKSKNIWCFGSWFGKKFSDNSKYLYLQAVEDNEIDAYWITDSIDVYMSLRHKGYKVYMARSLKGILIQMRAKVFVCTVNSRDFYFPTLSFRNTIIQLWHGSPLKKIGFDVKQPTVINLINRVRSILIDNYSYVTSPSAFFDVFSCLQ